MDLGYRAEDILWLVEHGLLTLGYQSSSYLTDRVPELGIVDLPFLFETRTARARPWTARSATCSARKIEERVNYRILGWFENGFRHISNRVRDAADARRPERACSIRVLPSKVQARTFELLGAVPMRMDLTEAIEMITAGTIDAQENPLSNTVTYGVHKFHRFHTLSNHFYISRPIFLHRTRVRCLARATFSAPCSGAVTDAVAFQRELHVRGGGRRAQGDRGAGLRDRRAHGRRARRLRAPRCSRCSTTRGGSSGRDLFALTPSPPAGVPIRSSDHCAAPSFANFGSKDTSNVIDRECGFGSEVRISDCAAAKNDADF